MRATKTVIKLYLSRCTAIGLHTTTEVSRLHDILTMVHEGWFQLYFIHVLVHEGMTMLDRERTLLEEDCIRVNTVYVWSIILPVVSALIAPPLGNYRLATPGTAIPPMQRAKITVTYLSSNDDIIICR